MSRQLTEEQKQSKRDAGRRWREKNKDKAKEQAKAWYEQNKERVIQRQLEYNANNKEACYERVRQWQQANPEYNKEYYRKNKETILERGREGAKQWRAANRTKLNRQSYKYKYGVTFADKLQLILVQDCKCAICRGDLDVENEGTRVHLDHDHTTGKIRGVLCARCNTGLGKFKDDVDLLRGAISYLEQHRD